MSSVKCKSKSHKKKSRTSHKPQPDYVYYLPRDASLLECTTHASAIFCFLHDCIASRWLSQSEIEEQAHFVCEHATKTQIEKQLTNNLDLFFELGTQYFIKHYLLAQEYSDTHPQEIEAAKRELQEAPDQTEFLQGFIAQSEVAFKNRGLL
jgi:hypothetical protein